MHTVDFGILLNWNLFVPLAPDENPSGVDGFGTEHDNLVISWKVSIIVCERGMVPVVLLAKLKNYLRIQ